MRTEQSIFTVKELTSAFGKLSAAQKKKIHNLSDAELEALCEEMYDFEEGLADLDHWLDVIVPERRAQY
ncbi:MAG: DUF4351 domain-containing protein [Cyanobacteriota bacterium]|nr:DUF4351 domain-containing protein [Cyanobacteriota bacterium]